MNASFVDSRNALLLDCQEIVSDFILNDLFLRRRLLSGTSMQDKLFVSSSDRQIRHYLSKSSWSILVLQLRMDRFSSVWPKGIHAVIFFPIIKNSEFYVRFEIRSSQKFVKVENFGKGPCQWPPTYVSFVGWGVFGCSSKLVTCISKSITKKVCIRHFLVLELVSSALFCSFYFTKQSCTRFLVTIVLINIKF